MDDSSLDTNKTLPHVAFYNDGDDQIWFIDANTIFGLFIELSQHLNHYINNPQVPQPEIVVKLNGRGYEIYIPQKPQGD